MKSSITLLLSAISAFTLPTFPAHSSCVSGDCATLGYTKAASDCTNSATIRCPFDTSKVYCQDAVATPSPEVGMIYYSDGTFSKSVDTSKTAVGIIAYLKNGHGFVVALEEDDKVWGTNVPDTLPNVTFDTLENENNMDGIANTRLIIDASGDHPAAKYCITYSAVSKGIGSNGWYLPTSGELLALAQNIDVINAAAKSLSKQELGTTGYWSSSISKETSYDYRVWYIQPSSSYPTTYDSEDFQYVRCALPI